MEEGQKIKSVVDLENGYKMIVFDDDTMAIVKVVYEGDVAPIAEALGTESEDKDDDEEEEEEEEEEELTAEALVAMDEEELTDLIDEQELKTDADDFEDDVDGLRKAIAKELGLVLPKPEKKKKK